MRAHGEVFCRLPLVREGPQGQVTAKMPGIAEMVRPKLIGDGMFLVGLDIVGDKPLEINVFTPGGLSRLADMYATDFAASVIAALEEKQTLRQAYGKAMTNSRLATL